MLVGALGVGRHFKRGREWGRRLLKQWAEEQKRDGLPRVIRKGRYVYTTVAVLNHYAGKPNEKLERKVTQLERDLMNAYMRIAELERRFKALRHL